MAGWRGEKRGEGDGNRGMREGQKAERKGKSIESSNMNCALK